MATDQADWTNSVTLYDQSGNPTSPGGSGVTTVFNHYVGSQMNNPQTVQTTHLGPFDGNLHRLTYASIILYTQAVVSTAGAFIQLQMFDVGTSHIFLQSAMTVLTMPTTGLVPQVQNELEWPGGLPITQQAVSTNQMSCNIAISAQPSGSLTSWNVSFFCTYGYS